MYQIIYYICIYDILGAYILDNFFLFKGEESMHGCFLSLFRTFFIIHSCFWVSSFAFFVCAIFLFFFGLILIFLFLFLLIIVLWYHSFSFEIWRVLVYSILLHSLIWFSFTILYDFHFFLFFLVDITKEHLTQSFFYLHSNENIVGPLILNVLDELSFMEHIGHHDS